jgi:hypothetical protein
LLKRSQRRQNASPDPRRKLSFDSKSSSSDLQQLIKKDKTQKISIFNLDFCRGNVAEISLHSFLEARHQRRSTSQTNSIPKILSQINIDSLVVFF